MSQSPEGYKRTEVGVIPEDWSVKQLDELAHINPENLSDSTNPDFAFNYISLEQVDRGKLLNHSEEIFRNAPSRARRYLQEGDVLMSTVRPNLMAHLHFHLQVPNAVCSTGFAVLRAKQGISDTRYLYAHLFGHTFNKQVEKILAGSNYPAINSSDIKLIKLPCPYDLSEQRAIADALSDVDGLLKSLDALIAKKRAIKQAAMQQLLTGKIRLPGFSGEWETKRLGDVASFFKGLSLSKTDLSLDGKKPCIHYGQLFTIYAERITEVLNRTDREGIFFYSVRNDVLMPASDVTPNGLATACCIRHSNVILGGDILVIRAPEDLLNGEFFAYIIKVNRNQVLQLVSGTTVFHLYGRDMANFSFSAPNVEEQSAITTVLSDMDAEIASLEQRLDKTHAIKQGMMQQLLTGHIRLVKTV